MQRGLIADGLGMKVIYFDSESKLPLGNAQPKVTLSSPLKEASVVSLHAPQHATTELLIGSDEVERLRQGAVLGNTSCGNVVDLDAVAEAFRSEHVGGAPIVVFPVYSRSNNDLFLATPRPRRMHPYAPHGRLNRGSPGKSVLRWPRS